MGTNGAYYRDYRGDDFDGNRDERFAEDDGREEGVLERSDDGKPQDQREDDYEHDPDESQYKGGRKYYGQYDHMGPDSDRRENSVPSRARDAEAADEDAQPLRRASSYRRLRRR